MKVMNMHILITFFMFFCVTALYSQGEKNVIRVRCNFNGGTVETCFDSKDAENIESFKQLIAKRFNLTNTNLALNLSNPGEYQVDVAGKSYAEFAINPYVEHIKDVYRYLDLHSHQPLYEKT